MPCTAMYLCYEQACWARAAAMYTVPDLPSINIKVRSSHAWIAGVQRAQETAHKARVLFSPASCFQK